MTAHEILDRRVYHTGEVIFREGESGRRCAFLVENGKVEIVKNTPSGPKVLGYIGTGGIFGEMALVDRTTRLATVACETDCGMLAIGRNTFLDLVKASPDFAMSLLNAVGERAKFVATGGS